MNRNEQKDESAFVLHIVLVGFHHKKGCQVEFSYPPMINNNDDDAAAAVEVPEEWKYLPFLALPDGAHNYTEDSTFFHLPPRRHYKSQTSGFRRNSTTTCSPCWPSRRRRHCCVLLWLIFLFSVCSFHCFISLLLLWWWWWCCVCLSFFLLLLLLNCPTNNLSSNFALKVSLWTNVKYLLYV